MRRFLSNADTPRSQHPEQEHIGLELDKDNEVQDIDNQAQYIYHTYKKKTNLPLKV